MCAARMSSSSHDEKLSHDEKCRPRRPRSVVTSSSPLLRCFAAALLWSALPRLTAGELNTSSVPRAAPSTDAGQGQGVAVVFVTSRPARNLTACRHGLVDALESSVMDHPGYR